MCMISDSFGLQNSIDSLYQQYSVKMRDFRNEQSQMQYGDVRQELCISRLNGEKFSLMTEIVRGILTNAIFTKSKTHELNHYDPDQSVHSIKSEMISPLNETKSRYTVKDDLQNADFSIQVAQSFVYQEMLTPSFPLPKKNDSNN